MKELTVGLLAKETGINVETVRYYEAIGLMPNPKRSSSGYRLYSDEDIKRLKFIKNAQYLGFTLKEIRELLFLRVDDETTCGDVKRIAMMKIDEVDKKISELEKIRASLESLANKCHSGEPKSECPILENLEVY